MTSVSTLVHELRQPLMAMKLRLQLVAQAGAVDGPVLREVLDQIGHLEEILAQHAHDAAGAAPAEVDFEDQVKRALVIVAPGVDAARVALEVRVAPGAVRVRHAPVTIRQVIVNLVRNALDAVAGADPKVVRLEVVTEASAVRVSVEDTGPGVAPEVARSLFEPFVTTKAPGEGTGLGLFIARGILEEHGGTLEVAPGSTGARFVASFPRA